jgi:protein-L-isoaspartate(D-aspartate) O-methyltransferase
MVCIMNESLELKPGHRVLEVGAGTGYHACTIAEIVAPLSLPPDKRGHVWTVEIVPQLADFAENNVRRLGYWNRVEVILGDGSLGLREYAPYDRILVTASAPEVPEPLFDQLVPGGILLIPVGHISFYQELLRVRKRLDGSKSVERLGGVAFVPLRGEKGWKFSW